MRHSNKARAELPAERKINIMLKKSLSLLIVWYVLAAVSFTHIFLTSAMAQVGQATITGTVTDQSGGVIPNARVVATNIETHVERETQTNEERHYSVPYLHPGQYEVAVESQGFSKTRVSRVNLTVGLTATVNVTLKPGALQEEVTVTSGAVQLEQQSASLGNVVGRTQIIELPLLGRNPIAW